MTADVAGRVGMYMHIFLDMINKMDMILSHAEGAEDAEIIREDVRDGC